MKKIRTEEYVSHVRRDCPLLGQVSLADGAADGPTQGAVDAAHAEVCWCGWMVSIVTNNK